MAYIKNIIKVELTEAKNLEGLIYPERDKCIIPSDISFRLIQCKNPSSCEITDKIESKVRIFTSKLTFKSCEQLKPSWGQFAYRITTADGCQYLIGRNHRPYPVISISETMPSSRTESSITTYTVTLSDIIKPLQIIE